jgi:hypothetical protein
MIEPAVKNLGPPARGGSSVLEPRKSSEATATQECSAVLFGERSILAHIG